MTHETQPHDEVSAALATERKLIPMREFRCACGKEAQ